MIKGELSLDLPPLQNEGGPTGLVPLEKVHPPINPGKVSSQELYKQFKAKYPILSIEDLVVQYKGISEEIVKKVVEGFECIAEVFHLYGLERPVSVLLESDFKGPRSLYFDRYKDVLMANRLYRYRKQVAVTKLLCYLLESKDSSLWVSYFKYKTCAFFAYYEGQEIPPAPAGLKDDPQVIFFPTWINHFKRSSLKKDNRRLWLSFLMTINQAKMGMPRDCESSIEKAEKKCALHLTTLPPPLVDKQLVIERPIIVDGKSHLTQDDIDFHEKKVIEINKDSICNQLRRTVREIFKGVVYTKDLHYEPFFPSTSSNYNRTRTQMGAVGEVMKFIEQDEELSGFLDKELIKMGVSEVKFRKELTRRYGDRGVLKQAELDLCTEESEGKAIYFFAEEFKNIWCRLFDKISHKAYHEVPYVEPLGLLEALKIRVISKGPPFLYTALKPLQKFLWGVLKKETVFRLIGTPITEELINKVIGPISKEEMLVNGDYKASTDNLHSWVSECLANEICDVLNENRSENLELKGFEITEKWRTMLIRSLTHHFFEVDGVWRPQLEGQLMGSITSFPFLCLANAAFCRWSLEIANNQEYRLTDERSRIKRAPLLINGDDCTLRGDRRYIRNCWETITAFGGLTSSVGKTFYSLPERPICMINSVSFDYDFPTESWIERKYINMGILLGKKRSIGSGQKEQDQVPYHELGTLHHELQRQSPPELWSQVSARFVYYNKYTLEEFPNVPWTAPEYLGGPGLVPNKPMSVLDLRCATLLIMNMKKDGGYHKKRYAVRKASAEQQWQLHRLVRKRLEGFFDQVDEECPFVEGRNYNSFGVQPMNPEIIYGSPYESLEDNYSNLYKLVVVETLFLRPTQEVYFAYDKDKQRAHNCKLYKINRQNNTAWGNAAKDAFDIVHLNCLQEHEIMHEKKLFVTPVLSPPMNVPKIEIQDLSIWQARLVGRDLEFEDQTQQLPP